MTSHPTPVYRELDHRVCDGIDVRLLWSERDHRLLVAVNDERNDESFTLEVSEPRRAMDAFHHPFAYAAGAQNVERAPWSSKPVTAS